MNTSGYIILSLISVIISMALLWLDTFSLRKRVAELEEGEKKRRLKEARYGTLQAIEYKKMMLRKMEAMERRKSLFEKARSSTRTHQDIDPGFVCESPNLECGKTDITIKTPSTDIFEKAMVEMRKPNIQWPQSETKAGYFDEGDK